MKVYHIPGFPVDILFHYSVDTHAHHVVNRQVFEAAFSGPFDKSNGHTMNTHRDQLFGRDSPITSGLHDINIIRFDAMDAHRHEVIRR